MSREEILLIGGPFDGQRLKVRRREYVIYLPGSEAKQVAIGLPVAQTDPTYLYHEYVRSPLTRCVDVFIYNRMPHEDVIRVLVEHYNPRTACPSMPPKAVNAR